MSSYEIDPKFKITDEATLRDMFPPTHELAIQKVQTTLDRYAQEFIRRSPFFCLGTQNTAGKADVSPRGDPVGFVKILDDETLAIPDRPGNNRLDSLANIVDNPQVGLLFIVPGFDETMRVTGRASLSTDPALLNDMAVNGRVPQLAIVVKVQTVFIHCAKAFRRAHLWDPAHHQDRKEMPSLVQIVLDITTGAPQDAQVQQQLDDDLEEAYKTTMY